MSLDPGSMALLVDNLPIIWQQATNCIFISARYMNKLFISTVYPECSTLKNIVVDFLNKFGKLQPKST